MKTKIIPFDLEMAKKIQSGEVEGKILNNLKNEVRIVCFDREDAVAPIIALFKVDGGEGVMYVRSDGHAVNCRDILVLEAPDNGPQFNSPYSIEQLNKLKEYTKQLMEVNQGVIDDLYNLVQDLKRTCEPPEQKHEFKPFDKVLVREQSTDEWKCDYFSHAQNDGVCTYYVCIGGEFLKCIPYEGNEHLVGTTDNF